MSGVKVPNSRTTKQPAMGYCKNPACCEDGKEFHFSVHNDGFSCPKCGNSKFPFVGLLTLIHLLLPDQQGPLQGKKGRYHIACDPGRKHLTNGSDQEACTGEVEIANCPGCLEEAAKLGIKPKIWTYDGDKQT